MKAYLYGVVFLLFFALTGCATIFSQEAMSLADEDISFESLRHDPLPYTGKFVILGGVIAGVKNGKGASHFEIVQLPLDSDLYPSGYRSGGRFLAETGEFIDPVVYAKGRVVTLFGEVKGKRVLTLDDTDYSYPVVEIRELHLWPEPRDTEVYYYGYPGYWPMWYGPWPYYYGSVFIYSGGGHHGGWHDYSYRPSFHPSYRPSYGPLRHR